MDYTYAHPSHPAMREMESLNRAFATGEYTANEFADALEDLVVRHGGKRVVLHTHANGISKVAILSADNIVIAEYHEARRAP